MSTTTQTIFSCTAETNLAKIELEVQACLGDHPAACAAEHSSEYPDRAMSMEESGHPFSVTHIILISHDHLTVSLRVSAATFATNTSMEVAAVITPLLFLSSSTRGGHLKNFTF